MAGVIRSSFALRSALLLALVALAMLAREGHSRSPASASAASGDFTGRVDIGGRKLYVKCRGTGRPSVILESGLRVRSDDWSENTVKPPATSVLPGVTAFTHVCAYDRPGTSFGPNAPSRSDPVHMPRTAKDAVADLHALLHAAHMPAPYVLVGHSTGGLIVRLFASMYPKEVAGLVLVDALPERLKTLMSPAQYATFIRLNTERPPELKTYRDLETIDLDASFAQMRQAAAAKPLRPMPLVVLSRGRPVALPATVPAGFSAALEWAWRTEQERLAKLVPNAQHVVAGRSEHYIQLQQPDLVIRAIRRVVDRIRHPL
jgi:pimeloyl-ACP methyl ester carboxylesterase